MHKSLIALLAIIVLVVGGYFAYEYVKQRPPEFLIKLFTATKPPPPLPAGDEAPLTVPEGFSAYIYSREVPGARVMTRDPKGAMLVSLTSTGKIVALPDLNGDSVADETITVLEGLNRPHGIVVICAEQNSCTLYVAETGELKAYTYDADTYKATFQKTVVRFPTDGGHYTRTLLPHPDGRLLVSVGSSCNVCTEESPVRASVQAVDLQTGDMRTFASGLRNTVFMALHPVTGEVWGTDNGRDLIGDDIPPDEVNIIKEGEWYGWPWFYGKNIEDMDFSPNARPSFAKEPVPSHVDLPAHSAALGLAFVPEEGWPEEMWHDLLIAYHGSWNRSEPAGYKVVRVDYINGMLRQDQFTTDFVTGFLPPGGDEDDAIGRPVGLMVEPGGVVYLSDDRAGAIYKIVLNEPAR